MSNDKKEFLLDEFFETTGSDEFRQSQRRSRMETFDSMPKLLRDLANYQATAQDVNVVIADYKEFIKNLSEDEILEVVEKVFLTDSD
jgi:hypothetical protein